MDDREKIKEREGKISSGRSLDAVQSVRSRSGLTLDGGRGGRREGEKGYGHLGNL